MEAEAEVSAVTELVACLENVTLMSKQLHNAVAAADRSKITQIYATLHSAHFHLSTFLARSFHPPPPQPSLLPPPPAENSLSSAAANAADDEPMQVVDEEEEEKEEGECNSSSMVDGVEEKIKGFFLQNKRLKRPLSPSVAEDRRPRLEGEGQLVRGSLGFDPIGTRLRALDLIYQFHG